MSLGMDSMGYPATLRIGIKAAGQTGISHGGEVWEFCLCSWTCLAHDILICFAVHNFFVPITDQIITKPKKRNLQQSAAVSQLEELEESSKRYRVWGMTARMLVDAARLAYAPEEPEFEHNSNFGDEVMIQRLLRVGRLSAEKKRGDELRREDMEKAAKL